MRVTPIRTARIRAGDMTLSDLLDSAVTDLAEGSVVAVTSKVVSLCEGRVVPAAQTTKAELVAQEAEWSLADPRPGGFRFTITHSTLIPSSGIDESNGDGHFVLWPADPQASANAARRHLRTRFGLRRVGVVITDSTCSPLRRGTSGIYLAHSGFRATNSYIDRPDLFGRRLRVSEANIAGGLAAAAVVAMGEGAERTPICVLDELELVRFQPRDPSAGELADLRISPEEDLFGPFLGAVEWRRRTGVR